MRHKKVSDPLANACDIWHIRQMENSENLRVLIDMIDKAAEELGIAPASLCRSATGNPRLYPRLLIRAETTRADFERVANWIDEHPLRDRRMKSQNGS